MKVTLFLAHEFNLQSPSIHPSIHPLYLLVLLKVAKGCGLFQHTLGSNTVNPQYNHINLNALI